MNNGLKVDVVIPLFNGRKWVKETLDSVFKQSLKPQRIIVVDDGSTDGSDEIVSQIPNIIFLRNPGPDKGGAAARNFGLKHATSEFVAFLDQDDVWHPEHLRILCTELTRYPETPAAATYHSSFYDGSQPQFELSGYSVKFIDPWKIYPLPCLDHLPSQTVFRLKALAEDTWSVEHSGMADYSIWMRLSVKNPFIRVSVKTLGYRKHYHSEYAQITRENPLNHINLWMRVSDDLLHYRLKLKNDKNEEHMLKRRNLIAHNTYNLLLSIQERNWELMEKAACSFEEILKNESADFMRLFFNQLKCFLSFDYFTNGDLKNIPNLYKILLEHYPENASIVKRNLIEFIVNDRPGLYFYLNYYISRPCQLHRLIPFISAIQNKFIDKKCIKTTSQFIVESK